MIRGFKAKSAGLFLGLAIIALISSSDIRADAATEVYASQRPTLASVKQTYDSIQEKKRQKLLFSPLHFSEQASATVISPASWRLLSNQVKQITEATHRRFEQLFGESPGLQVTIRLMDEKRFFAKTGAPAWTNAMYYHGEVIIPIADPNAVDLKNLKRSIRHEYAHAVIHSLSSGRCPGWLDEGIAQWLEGVENPALRPALKNWLRNNKPVDLALLQGGFTKLEEAMVPAAYAQSLFAATTLIQGYGFPSFRKYFDYLRGGYTSEYAFRNSFSIHEELFEVALEKKLRAWEKR